MELGAAASDGLGLDESRAERPGMEEGDCIASNQRDNRGSHGCSAEMLGNGVVFSPVAGFLYSKAIKVTMHHHEGKGRERVEARYIPCAEAECAWWWATRGVSREAWNHVDTVGGGRG